MASTDYRYVWLVKRSTEACVITLGVYATKAGAENRARQLTRHFPGNTYWVDRERIVETKDATT